MNGMLASALVGLANLIVGLIIVHFSSNEPRRKSGL
jgi:hypothetical protein